jgi:ubiquinone/menaquinone biosynthesis C-methylase UbiE
MDTKRSAGPPLTAAVADAGAEGAAELERVRLQAQVWELEAEALLDRIGVAPGWSCVDLGCGALGILGPLSRRVGDGGRVIGVDVQPQYLAAARAFVRQGDLANVELLEGDAYTTGLPGAAFDLVHARFLFAPVGRDAELLAEMERLVRPGGVLAIQEPDSVAWTCIPAHRAWTRLTSLIRAAFALSGGDFDAGRRTYRMLRRAGLHDVQLRATVLALADGHPYRRLPIQFMGLLRQRILDGQLMGQTELEEVIAECERVAADPDTYITTFLVTQVWGRMPTSPSCTTKRRVSSG